VPPWSWLSSLAPTALGNRELQRLLGRRVEGVPRERIQALPWFTLAGYLGKKVGVSPTERWARRNATFCRAALGRGFQGAGTVYAFNGAALELFRAARSRGMRIVLDQTAAPWRWNSELLREESGRWPGWESKSAEVDESGLMAAREEAEWELADLIVCGSAFIVNAISDIEGPVEKCAVVPYPTTTRTVGSPPKRECSSREGPLRVLFVGSLQLRKGIQYLWEVKMALGDAISVRAVGPSLLSARANASLADCMDLRGARPRSEVPAHLSWADVLVLPTLSEGAANVCYEAQGAGVPVLTTHAAGSRLEHGGDGWLVDSRDVESTVKILRDAEAVRKMRRALAVSPDHIRRRGLEEYGRDLMEVIDSRTANAPGRGRA